MGSFEEDRNLYFGDMGWSIDPMFSAENALEPDFDLSNSAQDFLQSGSGYLDSSDGLLNSNGMIQTDNNYISPRGIVEFAEQDSSRTKTKGSPAQGERIPTNNPETVSCDERTRNRNATDHGEDDNRQTHQRNTFALQQNQAFDVQPSESELREVCSETPIDLTEPTLRLEGGDGQEASGAGDLRTIHVSEYQQSNSHAVQEPHRSEIQHGGDNLDTTLRTEPPFEVPADSTDIPLTNNQTSNATGDEIESLVQLPDHVQFTGDFDALLPIQALNTPADDLTTQELLQIQMQIQHQELMTNSTNETSHIDLSSTVVAGNCEPSSFHPVGSEYVAPEAISAVQQAGQFMQTTTAIPLQSQVTSSPGLHLDPRAMQEVVQAYQNSMHPNLQSALPTNHGAHAQRGISPNLPISSQERPQQDFTTSAGLDRRLSVRPTEGTIKKRGRKKATRDLTKPPPTPRRKKSSNDVETAENDVSGFLVDLTGPGPSQGHYPQTSAAMASMGSFEAGTPSHYRPQTPKIPPTSRARGPNALAVGAIQPPGQNSENQQSVVAKRTKGAAASSSKNPRGAESGRVAKKTGKKGGRVNPETAHLSVEERRSLRAKRNRESAEKSRVRRKIQTAELETSVAELRDENKSLKSEIMRFQSQLSTMSMEVTRNVNTPAEQEQLLREHTPALFQALVVIQQAINDCPRTFRPQPHSPEIQLKVRR